MPHPNKPNSNSPHQPSPGPNFSPKPDLSPKQMQDMQNLDKLVPGLRHKDFITASTISENRRRKLHGERLIKDADYARKLGSFTRRLTEVGSRGTHSNPERGIELIAESAIEKLVTKPEEIPESFWNLQKQAVRNQGVSTENITDEVVESTIENIQENQRTSLETWVNYFKQTKDQYPDWFKLYAWDGVSKLGSFNKDKKQYNKRSTGTVTPYPRINPGALAKVYDAFTKRFSKEPLTDETLTKLTENGSFNRLYSHFLLEQCAIIPTPERTEDVKGEWIEYNPSDVNELMKAAQGTPWCISAESHARGYLKDENDPNNKSKFYLFHLHDQDETFTSPTGAASIHLNSAGNVEEISGLAGGSEQRLEPALVPIVEAKAKTLPGYERYKVAFAHSKRLINIYDRLEKEQPLTLDDIEFVYQLQGRIQYLGHGNYHTDERVEAVKRNQVQNRAILSEKYNDVTIDYIMNPDPIYNKEHIQKAIEKGIDPNVLVANMRLDDIANNLPTLLEAGAKIDVDELVSDLESHHIANNLPTLLQAGAKIDVDEFVSKLRSNQIAYNLPQLLEAGAKIDVDELVSDLESHHIAENLPQLLEAGANADYLVSRMDSYDIVNNLPTFLQAGAKIDVDELVSDLESHHIADNLPQLLKAGVNADYLVSHMDSYHIAKNLPALLEAGAKIDQVLTNLTRQEIYNHKDLLNRYGAQIS